MKFYFFKKEIMGEVAKWAIIQSPPPNIPEGLVVMLQKIDKGFDELYPKIAPDDEALKFYKDVGMATFDTDLMWGLLENLLLPIPEFTAMSAAKKKGIKYKDPEWPKATNRYSNIADEYDFVDLGALIMNVCNTMKKENWRHEVIHEEGS